MKPAIAYSIVMSLGQPTVVAITSERTQRLPARGAEMLVAHVEIVELEP